MAVPYRLITPLPTRELLIVIHGFHSPSRPNVQCLLTLRRAPSWRVAAGLSIEPDVPRAAPQAVCDGSLGPGSSTSTIVGAGGACVFSSVDVVVVVVVVTVSGVAARVAVAGLAGVVVEVLVAVGRTAGGGDGITSVCARAL